MVDTVRTLAALQALLADNTSGDIDPQDARDVLVSQAVPEWMQYTQHRMSDETAHADDDFFITDSSGDYTETTASGTAAWTYGVRDSLECEFANQTGGGAPDWAVSLKAVPAAGVPITIETRIDTAGVENENFVAAGLCFTSGTATSSEMFMMGIGGAGTRLMTTSLDGNQIFDADWVTVQRVHEGPLLIRLIWSAADSFDISVSTKGVRYVDLGAATFTRTFTPTHMGFAVTTYGNADPSVVGYDYLRVYESDLSV